MVALVDRRFAARAGLVLCLLGGGCAGGRADGGAKDAGALAEDRDLQPGSSAVGPPDPSGSLPPATPGTASSAKPAATTGTSSGETAASAATNGIATKSYRYEGTEQSPNGPAPVIATVSLSPDGTDLIEVITTRGGTQFVRRRLRISESAVLEIEKTSGYRSNSGEETGDRCVWSEPLPVALLNGNLERDVRASCDYRSGTTSRRLEVRGRVSADQPDQIVAERRTRKSVLSLEVRTGGTTTTQTFTRFLEPVSKESLRYITEANFGQGAPAVHQDIARVID